MTVQALATSTLDIVALRSQIAGRAFLPGDAEYDTARLAWNRVVNQHPALILDAHTPADIAAGVRFARAAGLSVAVQTTGHGTARPANEALLILTHNLTGVTIDPDAQTAQVEAGTQWGAVLEAAQAHGLAPLLGSSPTVGVVGYTLGGGLGWLARKYGLAADSVLNMDVVTADGQERHVNEIENAGLFWGLRGGGGSLAIVTRMTFRLYPVQTVYAGNLWYPAEAAQAVFTRYRDWVETLPDAMTTSIVLMNFPPIPAVPDFLRGQTVVMVRGCYVGPTEEGAALMQDWRDWMTPMADHFGVMPFSQAAAISNDPQDPMPGFNTGLWLKELDDDAIETLLAYSHAKSGLILTEVRHISGAVAQHADGSLNAYCNRAEPFLLSLVAAAPTPAAEQALQAYTTNLKAALAPHTSAGLYMNFLNLQEKYDYAHRAYTPEVYTRLSQLKAHYDPDNLFQYSFALEPAQPAR